jgi:putative endonuclease
MGARGGNDPWWVYMIACKGGRIYTGTARDPEARFRAHRAGKGAAFTRANPPIRLLHCVLYPDRRSACRAEAALKRLPREKKIAWAEADARAARKFTVDTI